MTEKLNDVKSLVRKNVIGLKPYSPMKPSYTNPDKIFLNANENSFGSASDFGTLNRYPDPFQIILKQKIGALYNIDSRNIFLSNGSDEAIDILMRVFCEPGKDSIIINPPTFRIYEIQAKINCIEVIKINLTDQYQLNTKEILHSTNEKMKMIFVCSPNNPTGNLINKDDIIKLLQSTGCIVILDEAYMDFSHDNSLLPLLNNFENLVIIKTLSKAWGLAGLRVGITFANEQIIGYMNKIKLPYNISHPVQQSAEDALSNVDKMKMMAEIMKEQKEILVNELRKLWIIKKIYTSEANFILVKTYDSDKVFSFLDRNGVTVKNCSNMPQCKNCIRITIGTEAENKILVKLLKTLNSNT